MRADRRQNGARVPALLGGLAVVLAAALLTFAHPRAAAPTVPDTRSGPPGRSVTGTPSVAPQQALHTVTTTAAGPARRLAEPGGSPPVAATVEPTDPPQ